MTAEAGKEAKPRLGGRSARVREAVLNATFDELGEKGYAGLSMESVARRSGVHKTTIYRRWPNRDALVMDALDSRSDRYTVIADAGGPHSYESNDTRARFSGFPFTVTIPLTSASFGPGCGACASKSQPPPAGRRRASQQATLLLTLAIPIPPAVLI